MIALSLRIALPVSLAPWHWFSPISSNDLEFEIQNRLFHDYDDDDKEVVLYYNRGMWWWWEERIEIVFEVVGVLQ